MKIISKAEGGGKDFEPVPAGVHVARCIAVVDCGLQEDIFKGESSWRQKVWIAFEIPSVRIKWEKEGEEFNKPAIIGNMYTNNLYKKSKLCEHLVSWRGKAFTPEEETEFDVSVILDKPCQISVTHNVQPTKTYANISAIMGVPEGMEVPARESELLTYAPGFSESRFAFEKLPEWLQKKVTVGHRLDVEHDRGSAPVQDMPSDPRPAPPIDAPYSGEDFDDSLPF